MFPAKSSFMLMKMFLSLLGLPPRHFVLEDSGEIRPKVQKYFVEPTLQYFQDNQQQIREIGLSEDSYVYPKPEVLNVEFRKQC